MLQSSTKNIDCHFFNAVIFTIFAYNNPHCLITNMTKPPPYIVPDYIFRCHIDKRQFRWPIIALCLFAAFVFVISSNFLIGLVCVVLAIPPLALFLVICNAIYRKVTYVICGNVLRISSPFNTWTIEISSIKKIRRGKFWVESTRNASASYIKLRIIYDKNQYVYVSPENEEQFIAILQSINPTIEYSSERNL